MADWVAVLQSTLLAGVFTVGVGFTVILNTLAEPLQPFAVGVIVILAVDGLLPVFVAVKVPILPVPLDARPIAAMLLLQP